jgi:hypothetical protein
MLSAWARGDYQRAVDMYLGLPFQPTPQMEAGIAFHKQWESEGRTTGKLPAVFGGRQLDSPKFEWETKKEMMLNDWLQLVLVLDVLEPEVGTDYKSGSQPVSSYSNGDQHKVYQVGYPNLKRFDYHGYNQYTKEVTMAIIHLTPKTLREGVEFVLKNSTEMRNYVIANNIERERRPTSEKRNI